MDAVPSDLRGAGTCDPASDLYRATAWLSRFRERLGSTLGKKIAAAKARAEGETGTIVGSDADVRLIHGASPHPHQTTAMKLLILNGPRAAGASQRYRGTYRRHPSFCDTAPTDDEINRLFFWFVEAGGELGVVDDLPTAVRYAELLNADVSTKSALTSFEVIQVKDPPFEKTLGQFLGIDLSSGYNSSLLWAGLTSYIENSADQSWDAVRPRWMEFKQIYLRS